LRAAGLGHKFSCPTPFKNRILRGLVCVDLSQNPVFNELAQKTPKRAKYADLEKISKKTLNKNGFKCILVCVIGPSE
jgi:hypothetical protein